MLYNLLYSYVYFVTFIISFFFQLSIFYIFFGSGGLSGEMLLVNIVENNKMDAFLMAG